MMTAVHNWYHYDCLKLWGRYAHHCIFGRQISASQLCIILMWNEICCILTLSLINKNSKGNSFRKYIQKLTPGWLQTEQFFTCLRQTMKYSRLQLLTQTTSAQQKYPSGKASSFKKKINPNLSSQYFMAWKATSKLFCAAMEGFARKTLHIMKYTEQVMILQNNLPPSSPVTCTIVQLVFGLAFHTENYI